MPCDQGEQRVVATAADPVAGVEVGAALPDNDLAGVHQLAAEPLDSQPLSIRVPTVARRGCALLVCHIVASALDVCDFDLGIPLSVALTSAVTGLVLELQNANLGTFCFCNHFGCHRCRAERRRI